MNPQIPPIRNRPSTERWRSWHEKDQDALRAWLRADVEKKKYLQQSPDVTREHWSDWLLTLFPKYFQDPAGVPIPFAPFHTEFWDWVWSLKRGVRPDPFIAIWPRAGGKSTSAEIACVALGAQHVRRYVWYVSSTQELADTHVQSISSLLESDEIARRYPLLSDRKVSKFGRPRAWRRNRLWTRSGLIVDALGLDTASRGVKMEEQRADLLVLDDLDSEKDSPLMVEKKIMSITRRIIPAGSADCAIVGAQNLVHDNSIFARLADGRADFLINRKVSGPHPALQQMSYRQETEMGGKTRTILTGGMPTWEGMGIQRCQELIDDIGLRAFMAECQHEKSAMHGKMYADVWHESIHVIPPFPIPLSWYVDRSHDWGSSAPFATLWIAEANGESFARADGSPWWVPKGSIFVIGSDYGWNGKPNEGLRMTNVAIGQRIKNVDARVLQGLVQGQVIRPGPADNQIFQVIDGRSIHADYLTCGVRFLDNADKGPGSRITGWKRIFDMLSASLQSPLEHPCLFVFDTCPQLIRTLPELPRDLKNPDDVDSAAEQHLGDCLRYRLVKKVSSRSSAEIQGV